MDDKIVMYIPTIMAPNVTDLLTSFCTSYKMVLDIISS